MSVPAGIDSERGPPMAVPLGHFLVGFAFLLAGSALGVASAAGLDPGLAGLAHVHLLLVGWVCLTIMGAMTQFVPVWSGVDLHSRRLAVLHLVLVAVGVAAFAGLLVAGELRWLPFAGGVMLAGFWTFAYNVGRSLARSDGLDATERHFALALGFLLVVTTLGVLLAFALGGRPLPLGLVHTRVVAAHVTLAVFGVVLTTVVGALYQLATMFTQTELDRLDLTLQRVEGSSYPVGVAALAGGRLFGNAAAASVGAVLTLTGLLAVAVVLARTLHETRVERTPMLSRYAVVAVALPAWAMATAPRWLARPATPVDVLGPPGASHLLLAGVVGFVLLGTLYHVVPFIVWVRRYADRVGLEPVPMIDDLYDDRVAAADFWLTLTGTALVVGSPGPPRVVVLGGVLATLGVGLFAANLFGVVVRHGPESLRVDRFAVDDGESRPVDEKGP